MLKEKAREFGAIAVTIGDFSGSRTAQNRTRAKQTFGRGAQVPTDTPLTQSASVITTDGASNATWPNIHC